MLDGEEYDLYATFDDPEKAIENVKEKCPDALTKLRRRSLTLGELSDGNWQRYRDVLAATSDGDNEQGDTLAAFFDIYENADKNAQIIKLADALSGSAADKAGEQYDRLMMALPYTSIEK